jgi:3-dehydroquinate dehydratase/shikimate dehydrogenase
MITLTTERLLLRPWQKSDWLHFQRLNSDPRVMAYFPATLSKEESDKLAYRIQTKFEENGFGLWAVTVVDVCDFIGFIGLNGLTKEEFPTPFTPAVEIGWRLAFDYWGKGYATEGAKAALAYGFETLHLNEIVAFTAVENRPSRRDMEKIGMHHNSQDDFDSPKLKEGHPLRRHVLYRVHQKKYLNQEKLENERSKSKDPLSD